MATRSNMKGFYKEKKSSISKKKKSPGTACLGSSVTQPSALKDDYEVEEELLRQFDLNTAYGPCVGMTRLARWERAVRLGMNPPKQVETLLKAGKVRLDSLWDGRI